MVGADEGGRVREEGGPDVLVEAGGVGVVEGPSPTAVEGVADGGVEVLALVLVAVEGLEGGGVELLVPGVFAGGAVPGDRVAGVAAGRGLATAGPARLTAGWEEGEEGEEELEAHVEEEGGGLEVAGDDAGGVGGVRGAVVVAVVAVGGTAVVVGVALGVGGAVLVPAVVVDHAEGLALDGRGVELGRATVPRDSALGPTQSGPGTPSVCFGASCAGRRSKGGCEGGLRDG